MPGKKLTLIFFAAILFNLPATAQYRQTGKKIGPTIGAAVLFGMGKMGNETDVLKRNMIHTPVEIFAGFNWRRIRFAINYEYNLIGQSDDPSNFSNQNIGGKGSSVGPRLGYYDGKQAFEVIYRASEKFTLDKATLAGTVAEYEGKGGFTVQYYRQLKKRVGVVIDYTSMEFKSSQGNSNDIKWDRIALGLVLTNFADSGRPSSATRTRFF